MSIAPELYDSIRQINIDEHSTTCAYEYWEGDFADDEYLLPRVRKIKAALGPSFTRTELLSFYREPKISAETKFIAAMMWGHEAPAGSRRDSRGPWKLSKMFSDPTAAEHAIRSVSIGSPADITKSYKSLHKALDRCGPNFFTKHFYFLGKSAGIKNYPLIFDDRVANGLMKIYAGPSDFFDMVRVSAARKPDAYLNYLNFAFDQAARIKCEPDQIEYYLFSR